jgi:hypothetical protein
MARHSKSVNIKIGEAWREPKKKAGRPVADKPLKGPDCRVCKHLDTNRIGPAKCGRGHELDARTCGEFRDSSVERPMLGGTSGVLAR